MQEMITHYGSSSKRIEKTVEWTDLIEMSQQAQEGSAGKGKGKKGKKKAKGKPATEAASLHELLQIMHETHPDFIRVAQLDNLPEHEFKLRKLQRPVGYAAHTRVHVGRLCIPMLNDSGSTCGLLNEEQVVLLINHTMKSVEDGTIKQEDYNYPIAQLYKYEQAAKLKGAENQGSMVVNYAVTLNVEFIPEGETSGPVAPLYFKIVKGGTSGIVGGVLGWPQMDRPHEGGEGLGWQNQEDGFYYSALGVTLPRLDDHRKENYLTQCRTYNDSKGQCYSVKEAEAENARS
jgi:hypothetical protein